MLLIPFMRAMRPTLFIPKLSQLAVIVLLTIVPFISAIPSQPAGSSKCVENPGEICGDSDGLDLHRSGFARDSDPTIVQQFQSWFYMGCFPDANDNRILTIPMTDGINSISYCLTSCQQARANYAGVEWGTECWCAQSFSMNSKKFDSDQLCNITCPGNPNQHCGGSHTMLIYNYVRTYD